MRSSGLRRRSLQKPKPESWCDHIGRPLIAELIRRGHTVTGMTRSEVGARHLAALGAVLAQVSAFDAPALERAPSAAMVGPVAFWHSGFSR
jgi:nucleoside-diphosphate-sugar epimerase